MNPILWIIPLALVVFVSGCTIPGFGGGTTAYENDVVVIKDLQAIPSAVKSTQQIRLVGYIENLASKSVDTVAVDLFDHCDGLFTDVKVTCEGTATDTKCSDLKLLPKEIKEVDWVLTPSEVSLKTDCELKVLVEYPFKTIGLTSMSLINEKEMQTQLERGAFRQAQSAIVKGEGPVKVFMQVEDKQPVIISDKDAFTPVSLNVENRGSGFIKGSKITVGKTSADDYTTKDCDVPLDSSADKTLKVIKDKISVPCKIQTSPNTAVVKELTKQLTSEISYSYEFRKSVKVSVDKVA